MNFLSVLFSKLANASPADLNEERYNQVLEEYTDGYWRYDIKCQRVFFSPKLVRLTGYTLQDITNQPFSWWTSRIHELDQSFVQQKLLELQKFEHEFMPVEAFRFLCKNNSYIWLQNHIKILRDKNSEPVTIMASVKNITSFKNTEERLKLTLAEQKQDMENRTKFLSALNHDLRSPLSGVIGMVSLLKETSLSTEQLHFIDNIANSCEMLLTLVNNILEISKLHSGKYVLEKIPFSPARIIKQVSDLTSSQLIKKKLAFRVNIEGNIPDSLTGDPTRLQQILVNLLGNAVKFTSEGSIIFHIKEITTFSTPSNPEIPGKCILRFEIIDTGIGVAAEVQGKLFEEFTQANASISRLYGGTGLGLSICKELVQMMQGKIGLYSNPEKGSTFWFEIPFDNFQNCLANSSTKKSGCEARHQPELVVNKPSTGAQKLVILLAEDNLVNQEVMTGLLACLGDEVTIANNGQEAVDLFPARKFDIVLMDLNMPVLDGLSAAQIIRQLPNGHIPIIAVTANTFIGDKDTCYYHGITSVLNKPITKASLQEALSSYRTPALPDAGKLSVKGDVSGFVNNNTLKCLITDLGLDTIERLLNIYRVDGLKLLNQIKISPPENLDTPAHTLAGMSENLGFTKVGKVARSLMGKNSEALENAQFLIQELETDFNNTLEMVDLQKLASS